MLRFWGPFGAAGDKCDGMNPVGGVVDEAAGLHAYDGSYTALHLNIRGLRFTVESAHVGGDDLVLRVTPSCSELKPPVLMVEAKLLWNRPGTLSLTSGGNLTADCGGHVFTVFATTESVKEPFPRERGVEPIQPFGRAMRLRRIRVPNGKF